MAPQRSFNIPHRVAKHSHVSSVDHTWTSYRSPGDLNAFWELWESYRHELFSRHCLRWMGGNVEDAEDALSSAGLKALEYLSTHDVEISNVKHWFKRLLYNHCMTIWRQHKQSLHLDLPRDTGHAPSICEPMAISAWHAPEQTVLCRELRQVLQSAIDHLPSLLREPARLRFLYNMRHRDIAFELDVCPANVRKRIQHARPLLQAYVRAHYNDAPKRPVPPPSRLATKPDGAPASPSEITDRACP
jgi:RNA polymerase sigma factor (sigma-70 family)